MSYDNVVRGKLNLKGKALDVKSGSVKKKQKKERLRLSQIAIATGEDNPSSIVAEGVENPAQEVDENNEHAGDESARPPIEDHRTPAEKRYHEQKLKLDAHRLAKTANKSHRERIEGFNQYLANLSEHYDIPKVGPG